MKTSELTDADFEQSGITSKQFFKLMTAYRSAGENAYKQQAFNEVGAKIANVNMDIKLATLTPALRERLFDAYDRGWKSAHLLESFWEASATYCTSVVPVHPIMKPPGLFEDPLALFT
jgi:hypothetical protein